MKKFWLLTLMCLTGFYTQAYAGADISDRLLDAMTQATEDNGHVRAIVMLSDQVDVNALSQQLYGENATLQRRAYVVITALQEKAAATQGPLLSLLESRANEVLQFETYWVTNAIYVEATPSVIYELADQIEVDYIDLNAELEWDRPIVGGPAAEQTNSVEPGLRAIKADKMWAKGHTGVGVLVMNIDTGVNINHPALGWRWHGNSVPSSQAWFDPVSASTIPNDCDGGSNHGTHTMGTITGLDPATGDTVGVAWGAEWIAAGLVDCGGNHTANVLAAFQWAMDPDGNPGTADDMPAAIGNSYQDPFVGNCDATYINTFNAAEAAGIAVVFSAGNSGPGASTITKPKNINTGLVNVWSTGALDGNNPSFPIASFSSRGPSACVTGNPSLDIKPEASAPGVSVRSSQFNSYGTLSGTSMACPHVVGAVALLRGAHPNKTGEELKLALYNTAVDLGTPGEDNTYGMGIIDVYAAHLSLADPEDPNDPENFTAYSDYTTTSSILLTWTDPVTLVNGDTLTNFGIEVWRDGDSLTFVASGVETYTDNNSALDGTGLNDGQLYQYTIFAVDLNTDSSSQGVDAEAYAGGAPTPDPPASFFITTAGADLVMNWTNPSTQIDGTPLDDFAGIKLYEDGGEVMSYVRSNSDSGAVDSAVYTPPAGTHSYYVTAFDDEIPSNESDPSNSSFSPIDVPFFDDFPTAGPPNPGFWINSEAEVNGNADNPPSPPNALNLNGFMSGGDLVTLLPVDLSALADSGVALIYSWQPQGNGELPDATDSLIVELRNSLGSWRQVTAYNGRANQPFIQDVILLDNESPGGGATWFYPAFQFRFRSVGTASATTPFDDWFVDDVFLGRLDNDPAMVVSATAIGDTAIVGGATQVKSFTIENAQSLPSILNYSITENPPVAWLDVSPASGAISSADGPVQIDATFDPAAVGVGVHNTTLFVSGDDPANPQDTINVTFQVNEAPDISVSDDSLFFALAGSQVDSTTFRIINSGSGPLEFTIENQDLGSGSVQPGFVQPQKPSKPEPKGYDAPTVYGPAMEGKGGPDPFGYRWIDSDEPGGPAYSFTDISGTGTVVTLLPTGTFDPKDEGQATINLPFNVNYYGNPYNQVQVNSNGFITFDINFFANAFTNVGIPSSAEPNGIACAFWDDLDGRGLAGDIYYQQIGNRFIIQWHDWGHFSSGTQDLEFQIILYQNSSTMDFVYANMDLAQTDATVGIENLDGTIGLEVALNTAYVHSGLLTRFSRSADWMTLEPTAGIVPAGDSTSIKVTANAAGLLGGNYLGGIAISSNDPDTPDLTVIASLDVTGVPDIGVSPDTVDFGVHFINAVDTMNFAVENTGTDQLDVTAITVGGAPFSVVGPTTFSLNPFETQDVSVAFSSASPGVFNDVATITSNAQSGTATVTLTGEAINPPVLALSDTLINGAVDEGDTTIAGASFWIYNQGLSDLDFSISENEDPLSIPVSSLKPVEEEVKVEIKTRNQNGVVPKRTASLEEGASRASGAGLLAKTGKGAGSGIASVNAERSPNASAGPGSTNPEAIFDVQFDLDIGAASGALGNAGCEFDGTYFYSTRWASNLLHKYDQSGNLIEEFSIPGVSGLRDLAFDGTYMYGGAAATTIYQMDFTTKTLVGTITSPVAVRNISYDAGNDAFWVANWDTDVMLVSRAGATLATIPVGTHGLGGMYGSAYDDFTPGGPYLWLFDQGLGVGFPQPVVQFDLNTLTPTGLTFDVVSAITSGGIAGGLFIADGLAPGFATLGGIVQGDPGSDKLFGLELTASGLPWTDASPVDGTVSAGDSVEVLINWYGVLPSSETVVDGYFGIQTNDPVNPVGNVHVVLDIITGIDDGFIEAIPESYALHQNYPNPFNPRTTIKYDLKQDSRVVLKIYNLLGQEVRTLVNTSQKAGFQSIVWDGKNNYGLSVSSGIYVYRIEAGEFIKSRKMMFLK